MPLVMKWRQGEIALYPSGSGDATPAEVPIGRIELSFELKQTSLVLSEDRHRLLAALQQLRLASSSDDILVDLLLPAEWGVTHQIPDPNLKEAELREHLRWEISKALIDSEDQYRYNFGFTEDGAVLISALRLQILDSAGRLCSEAGYQVQGIFLDAEPYHRINLIGRAPETPPITDSKPIQVKPQKSSPVPDESVEHLYKMKTPSTRFFTLVLIAGILIVAYFAYIKFTRPKSSTFTPTRQTVAKLEEKVALGDDSTSAESTQVAAIPQPAETTKTLTDTVKPEITTTAMTPISGRYVDMRKRLDLVKSTLSLFSGGNRLDLMSFTADRFLCQVNAVDSTSLEQTLLQIKGLSNLEGVKTSRLSGKAGDYRGVISGRMSGQVDSGTLRSADKESVVVLGKKHGLSSKELVFTGPRSNMLEFLNDIAAAQYGVYRLILVPWENDEFRAVLEL
ncbi:MAG: hypothetical protein NTW14_07820 [bacterium]|nr:hypothetical protein [bacterium]